MKRIVIVMLLLFLLISCSTNKDNKSEVKHQDKDYSVGQKKTRDVNEFLRENIASQYEYISSLHFNDSVTPSSFPSIQLFFKVEFFNLDQEEQITYVSKVVCEIENLLEENQLSKIRYDIRINNGHNGEEIDKNELQKCE